MKLAKVPISQNELLLYDEELILKILSRLLKCNSQLSLRLAEKILEQNRLEQQNLLKTINLVAAEIGYKADGSKEYAIELLKLCLKFKPNNLEALKNLFWFYFHLKQYNKALDIGNIIYKSRDNIYLKIFANYQILNLYLFISAWDKVNLIAQKHINLLRQLLQQENCSLDTSIRDGFIMVTQPLPYLQDKPQENRILQNKVSQIFQENGKSIATLNPSYLPVKSTTNPLKIGYVAHTLRSHSVGWLSRWLIHYHNREDFKIAIYCINQGEDIVTQKWFQKKADLFYHCTSDTLAIAKKIQEDEIDILVDLDSITLNVTCHLMSLKAAPVQVTWLGCDASGLPSIDYFIADPYVLPKDAQNYYREKIWRLPDTYVAVDGFEVGIPTITRQRLAIPDDAIIYLNHQNASKRHPDTIRLQMKIVKQVPHSYLLIKGSGDPQITRQFYTQLAAEEGVDSARLRFLSRDIEEMTHRANLQIADVVLDTYPYNGATTTLETLWMGIPLVTRVGEQFAARNSYAFMMNVGVSEGIAWTEEEYIKWGIKLGSEEKLRQQVAWKLSQSRKTSPLWNARQFTREMEKAYQKMWQNYLQLA